MKLYSYEKVHKVEKKLYGIMNVSFPVPVALLELGYFGGLMALMYAASSISPAMAGIPAILKYIVLPFFGMKFLLKKKLDGKNPLRYFRDYFLYLARGRRKKQFFRPVTVSRRYRVNWTCGTRTM